MNHHEVVTILQDIEYKPGFAWRVGGTGDLWLQVQHAGMGGRKWRLSEHMTRSEVVQTAFMALLAWEEHEAREAFRYIGARVFGPHISIEALINAADRIEVRT